MVLGETTVGRNEYVLPAVTLVGGEPCKINWAAVGVDGDVVEVEEVSLGVLATVPGPEQPLNTHAVTINAANPGRPIAFVFLSMTYPME